MLVHWDHRCDLLMVTNLHTFGTWVVVCLIAVCLSIVLRPYATQPKLLKPCMTVGILILFSCSHSCVNVTIVTMCSGTEWWKYWRDHPATALLASHLQGTVRSSRFSSFFLSSQMCRYLQNFLDWQVVVGGVAQWLGRRVFGWHTFPDLWLICDHFIVSAVGQPTRPTQPSIPSGSVIES